MQSTQGLALAASVKCLQPHLVILFELQAFAKKEVQAAVMDCILDPVSPNKYTNDY